MDVQNVPKKLHCGHRDRVMHDKKCRPCLSAALSLTVTQHAWGDTMRCGNKLIVPDDSMAVVTACRGPQTVAQSSLQASTNTIQTGTQSHTICAEVLVEM